MPYSTTSLSSLRLPPCGEPTADKSSDDGGGVKKPEAVTPVASTGDPIDFRELRRPIVILPLGDLSTPTNERALLIVLDALPGESRLGRRG